MTQRQPISVDKWSWLSRTQCEHPNAPGARFDAGEGVRTRHIACDIFTRTHISSLILTSHTQRMTHHVNVITSYVIHSHSFVIRITHSINCIHTFVIRIHLFVNAHYTFNQSIAYTCHSHSFVCHLQYAICIRMTHSHTHLHALLYRITSFVFVLTNLSHA